MITDLEILNDLKNIGVKKGDIIFIAADLMRVGYFKKNRECTLRSWVEIIKNSVGKEGTIVIPSYTKSFLRFRKENIVFTKDSEPDAGSLSLAFFKYSKYERSMHPTNSCMAIGPRALEILDGHDHQADPYKPYKKVIALNGKNLMLGALSDKRLAPMAMHAAQEHLGLTRKHFMSKLVQTYYIDKNNEKKLFMPRAYGGCTGGGYKTFGHHIADNAINLKKIGRSMSAYIDCNKSFKIFVNILSNNPGYIKCDRRSCASCYGNYIYNNINFIPFWIRKFINKSLKLN